MSNHIFKERNVFESKMYEKGIFVAAKSETDVFVKREKAEESDKISLVVPLSRGKVYVIRFNNKPCRLRTAACASDPCKLSAGEGMSAPLSDRIPYCEGDTPEDCNFMYIPNKEGEYLVVDTGEELTLEVAEIPLLLGYDTEDEWWYAPEQKDLFGNVDSWADWRWTSDEVFENIYEPLRERYPDYISRSWIGKDQSGKYDMWSYIFAPEGYEQTLFLTSGIHSEETDGYLGLARFLTYLAEEDGSHAGMHYLRNKVRLVVVPLVNVGGASDGHTRENIGGVNLNRDFGERTQAETINVIHLFRQYAKETAAVMDFHTSLSKTLDLFYAFPIESEAAPCWLKTTNHIYERLKSQGLTHEPTPLTHVVGKYRKAERFLQGYIYNNFGVPALICEHHHHRWYEQHSGKSLQFACEFYGNFIIQTALAKLKITK